jgi:hypothetical protein
MHRLTTGGATDSVDVVQPAANRSLPQADFMAMFQEKTGIKMAPGGIHKALADKFGPDASAKTLKALGQLKDMAAKMQAQGGAVGQAGGLLGGLMGKAEQQAGSVCTRLHPPFNTSATPLHPPATPLHCAALGTRCLEVACNSTCASWPCCAASLPPQAVHACCQAASASER